MLGSGTLEEARLAGFRNPPPRTVHTPAYNAHTHIGCTHVAELIQGTRADTAQKVLAYEVLRTACRSAAAIRTSRCR